MSKIKVKHESVTTSTTGTQDACRSLLPQAQTFVDRQNQALVDRDAEAALVMARCCISRLRKSF